jgi:hypothetical protein
MHLIVGFCSKKRRLYHGNSWTVSEQGIAFEIVSAPFWNGKTSYPLLLPPLFHHWHRWFAPTR